MSAPQTKWWAQLVASLLPHLTAHGLRVVEAAMSGARPVVSSTDPMEPPGAPDLARLLDEAKVRRVALTDGEYRRVAADDLLALIESSLPHLDQLGLLQAETALRAVQFSGRYHGDPRAQLFAAGCGLVIAKAGQLRLACSKGDSVAAATGPTVADLAVVVQAMLNALGKHIGDPAYAMLDTRLSEMIGKAAARLGEPG